MLFHLVAFPYMNYSQSYGASNTMGWDLEKWVLSSLLMLWQDTFDNSLLLQKIKEPSSVKPNSFHSQWIVQTLERTY